MNFSSYLFDVKKCIFLSALFPLSFLRASHAHEPTAFFDEEIEAQDDCYFYEENGWDELADAADPSSDSSLLTHTPDSTEYKINPFCCHELENHFSLGVEFLYWKMDEEGADYAISKTFPVYLQGGIFQDGLAGKLKEIDFPWEPGVRARAAYQFLEDQWTIFAEYTYYHANQHDTAHAPSKTFGVLNGTFPTFLPGSAEKATSHFEFDYNVFDLNISHLMSIGKKISFDFLFGVRTAWMEHDWHLHYQSSGSTNPGKSRSKIDWDYVGVGGDIGLMSNWCIGMGFNLFAKLNFAALYGVFTNKLSLVPESLLVPENGPVNRLNQKKHKTVWDSQIGMGLGWCHPFSSCLLQLRLSYEFTNWRNLNEHFRYPFASGVASNETFDKVRGMDTTDLNLQGLTTSVFIDF